MVARCHSDLLPAVTRGPGKDFACRRSMKCGPSLDIEPPGIPHLTHPSSC